MTGLERPNESFLSTAAQGSRNPLPALPLTACTSLSTRTHFVFHTQWARKENTLSLLTKHRQGAKSLSLLSELLSSWQQGWQGMWDAPLWSAGRAPAQPCTGTGQAGNSRRWHRGFVSPLLLRDWRDKGSSRGRIQIFGRDCAGGSIPPGDTQPITPCCDGS